MNKIKIYAAGIILLLTTAAVIPSCTKTFDEKINLQTSFTNSSLVQVYMAMVNANRNYIYVDSKLINGGGLLTTGNVFPSSAYAASIPGGFRAFLVRDTLSTTTQAQLSFSENLQVGKNYTVFVYDTITAPKQKTVETNIVVPTDTTARIRFANFVYNPTVLDGFDIYSKKRNQVIFSNVKQTEVTEFIPYASALTDTFYIRPTGTTNNLQNWRTTTPVGAYDVTAILTPAATRNYTLVFRGGWRATASSNTTVRTLSVFTNY